MDARLEALEREFVSRYLEFHPGSAAFAGLHKHDSRLEDFSRASIVGYCQELEAHRAKARALGALGPEDEAGREALLAMVDGALSEYRQLRQWERDPSWYMDTLSAQLNIAVIFDYAPPEERLRTIAAKERLIPRYLEIARENLEPTAPILVDYGLRGAEGALSLVRKDLPAAFASVTDASLRSEFEEATEAAAEAIEQFMIWLRDELPEGPRGAFALGREAFTGWLAARERITTPLDELEGWALDAIDQTREELQREAGRFDASASPTEVVDRITRDHPATGRVVGESTRIAEEVYAWVHARDVVSFPGPGRVLIADTPEFMRWSFGSMWTPGPYEKAPVRATFYATDADPKWSAAKQEEHLTAFSYRGLENLAIHEAYPGHYIQGLHQNRVQSPIRRTFWWGVFGEGWAHYCEQMAIEEGFGDGAPEVHIVQLQEALNRLCRFVNGIRLHTDPGWDFDRGTRFFQEKAWLTEAVARSECERGAFDPFYLRYTLGKKEILDIREECRRRLGSRFSLKEFHDALLGCGSGPMPVMRTLTLLKLGVG